MRLSSKELQCYNDTGLTVVSSKLSCKNIQALRTETERLLEVSSADRIDEGNQKAVRALHGCHLRSKIFDKLTRHPALFLPASQILGNSLYVHQLKINVKAARFGQQWEWHQDFVYWNREDGISQPALLNVAVFLDGVYEFNGPMQFISGSHSKSFIEVVKKTSRSDGDDSWRKHVNARLPYVIDTKTVARLLATNAKLVKPTGPPGSIMLFDPNIVHSSDSNRSGKDRKIVIVTYNRTDNLPKRIGGRPDFLCSPNTDPLAPLCNDNL